MKDMNINLPTNFEDIKKTTKDVVKKVDGFLGKLAKDFCDDVEKLTNKIEKEGGEK